MAQPNNPDNLKTTVSLYKTTRDKINKLRNYPNEPLDSVINREIEKNKNRE